MKDEGWVGGNSVQLLENGEEFFPAVFAAIEAAQREVLVETFILFEDKVGLALHAVLAAAAKRGVRVDVTIDGFGSPSLSAGFVRGLTDAGVNLHVFDAPPRLSRKLKLFRRLHRKIVVVDGQVGFIGGINYSADHLGDFGPEAKQDYSVEVRGPVVAQLRDRAMEIIAPAIGTTRWWRRRRKQVPDANSLPATGQAQAKVVVRDNHDHRTDIERYYRMALMSARNEVIIANAYFFPGYLLLRGMQRAAKRGVKVHLILQGCPDILWATWAARMIYRRLIESGVCIHEYCDRPIHAKVAVVDDEWATVGSSNLDPLSLSLNLEANLVIRDRGFNQVLRDKLTALMAKSCKQVQLEHTTAHPWLSWLSYFAFHAVRHFPRWATYVPVRRPVLTPAAESSVIVSTPVAADAQPWHWRDMLHAQGKHA
jgi:cardiolipin synthase